MGGALGQGRHLHEHVGVLGGQLDRVPPLGQRALVGDGRVAHVVDDDPQARKLCRGCRGRGEHLATVDVDGEVVLGEAGDVGGVGFVGKSCEQFVAIDANSAIEPVLRKPIDQAVAAWIAQRQIAHDAHDAKHAGQPLAVMTRGQIKQPLVVFDPRTRLHDHRAGHAQRLDERLPLGRQDGTVEFAAFARPRHPFRSRWVVEVGVGVDHRSWECRRCGTKLPLRNRYDAARRGRGDCMRKKASAADGGVHRQHSFLPDCPNRGRLSLTLKTVNGQRRGLHIGRRLRVCLPCFQGLGIASSVGRCRV